MKRVPRNAVVSWMALMSLVPSDYLPLMQAANPQQQTTAKSRRAKSSGNKATQQASKKAAPQTAKKKSAKATGKRKTETSSDVKRQQEATNREIRQTEQQIKENDRSIKKGLSELGKLQDDISVSKKRISETTGKITSLSGKISSLESGISGNEAELQKLRDEYLKAVKKMRSARKNRSALAFVFASDNFNQALRRMRYLRQFSEWRDRQTAPWRRRPHS